MTYKLFRKEQKILNIFGWMNFERQKGYLEEQLCLDESQFFSRLDWPGLDVQVLRVPIQHGRGLRDGHTTVAVVSWKKCFRLKNKILLPIKFIVQYFILLLIKIVQDFFSIANLIFLFNISSFCLSIINCWRYFSYASLTLTFL
jgi:hypothetical protein